jgi:hypothetical protein
MNVKSLNILQNNLYKRAKRHTKTFKEKILTIREKFIVIGFPLS